MKKILLLLLLLVTINPTESQAQITNPNIPRSWWSGLKTYITETAEMTFGFNSNARSYAVGALEADTVAVFTPKYNMTVSSVDLWFNSISDPDSTLYLVFAQSKRDTVITIDSTGNGFTNYWQSSLSIELVRAVPCSIFIFLGKNSASTGKSVVTIHGRNK